METAPSVLDYYATPHGLSAAGRHAPHLSALPDDLGTLVRIVQGLVLHQFTAWVLHGVEVDPERRWESHIRPVDRMLDRLLSIDPRPLHLARPPALRLVGVCRHFALLLIAILRAKGVPARARWGFGAYFNPPWFEDHVLCEVWQPSRSAWVLVEPQLDEVWQAQPGFDFDILDVPAARFPIAWQAWQRCRGGLADAGLFGIFEGNQRGLWFIAGALLKDAAALVRTETLAWDVWGAMPRPGETLDGARLEFFDWLADLTRNPDRSLDQLKTLFATDERLRLPPAIYNAVRGRLEPFPEGPADSGVCFDQQQNGFTAV